MDFSPNGELMALIDYYGVCIIPDVSTNEPRLHIEVGTLGKIDTQTNFSAHYFYSLLSLSRCSLNYIIYL